MGTYKGPQAAQDTLQCDEELRKWLRAYSATFKPSTEETARTAIEYHLIPHFGSRALDELRETDLLFYVRTKLDAGKAPLTIRNHLAILRRVLTLLHREGRIQRNPASRIGELMRRVDRRGAEAAHVVDSWTREEVQTLLSVAQEHTPRFHPPLAFLCYTGCRSGEALGLQWCDVDFERRRIHVRRAIVRGQLTSPKSGRSRFVLMAPELGRSAATDLGAATPRRNAPRAA